MSLVVWSGGCDSTLVLYDLLKEQSEHPENDLLRPPVRAISINHCQVGAETQQKKARQRILERLRKKGFTILHTEVDIKNDGGFAVTGCGGLIQPAFWLPTAIPYLKEDEDLYLGYIAGDDIWHYRSDIFYVFEYMSRMTHRKGKLQFPLEWTKKYEVINRLKKARLLSLIYSCENPKSKDTMRTCGRCNSCLRHTLALAEAKLRMK